jgi:hypothetical protein
VQEKEVEVIGPIIEFYRYIKYLSVANNKLKDVKEGKLSKSNNRNSR